MSDECINMPMLTVDGSNWVNYHDHIVPILRVKKLADHLVSNTPTPRYMNAGNINGLTPAQHWAKDEDITVVMLNALIPDAIYTQVKGGNSVKALWDTLKSLFEGCSCNWIMDLTNKLQFSKCSEGDNLRTHFLDLTNLHDQLSTMGKSFSDKDFATILLRSLLDSYKMQVLSIITSADMTNTAISPSLVIHMLSDEYDNCVQAGTARKPPKNEAFKSEDQGKSKKRNCNAQCENCNKKGHTKAECWAKGGGREGQFEVDWWKGRQGKKDDSKPDSSKKASNNNADSTDIKAWAAIEVINDLQAQAWYLDHIGEEVANTQQLANKALHRPLTYAAKEGIWLHRLLIELSLLSTSSIPILCDNQSTLKLTTEDNYHSRTKHIDTHYHYIQDVIAKGLIEIAYCSTEDMTVDALTKPLPAWKLNIHLLRLRLLCD
jgi:LTR polyprotein gag-polypeptide-like protein